MKFKSKNSSPVRSINEVEAQLIQFQSKKRMKPIENEQKKRYFLFGILSDHHDFWGVEKERG